MRDGIILATNDGFEMCEPNMEFIDYMIGFGLNYKYGNYMHRY